MALGDFPDSVPIDLKIVVHDRVAHTGNRTPRYGRVGVLNYLRKSPGGFSDDLNVTQDMRSDELICIEVGARGFVESTSPIASSMSASKSRSVLKAAPPRPSSAFASAHESRPR